MRDTVQMDSHQTPPFVTSRSSLGHVSAIGSEGVAGQRGFAVCHLSAGPIATGA